MKWYNHPADGSYAVNWTNQLTDVADWAKRPEILAGIPDIKGMLDQQKNVLHGATLQLSNQGWDVIHVYPNANQ